MPLCVSVELPPEHTYLRNLTSLTSYIDRRIRMKEEKKQSFGPQFKEFMHQSTEKSESYSFHKYGAPKWT